MNIGKPELKRFIKSVRNIVGRDVTSPFSLEDIYHAACALKLDGVIYLGKLDDEMHVNVLLGLNKDKVNLYDPLFFGVREKSYDEIQLGMYCQPVGTFRDEFQKYEQQQNLDESGDVWTRFEQRGRLLFDFLSQNKRFRSVYVDSILTGDDLPPLQDNESSSNCAPISLFVMFLYNYYA